MKTRSMNAFPIIARGVSNLLNHVPSKRLAYAAFMAGQVVVRKALRSRSEDGVLSFAVGNYRKVVTQSELGLCGTHEPWYMRYLRVQRLFAEAFVLSAGFEGQVKVGIPHRDSELGGVYEAFGLVDELVQLTGQSPFAIAADIKYTVRRLIKKNEVGYLAVLLLLLDGDTVHEAMVSSIDWYQIDLWHLDRPWMREYFDALAQEGRS